MHVNKINGKVYVGQTKHKPEDRWKRNGSGYKAGIFRFAINKYGWDNFEHIIVKTNLTKKEADDLEIALIKYYKSLKMSYNITDGGEGTTGMKMSEESRRKMSVARKGKVKCPEYLKLEISKRFKGIPKSQETRSKISKALKGKPKSEIAKLRMRQNHVYTRLTPVLKYDRLLNLICEYPSIAEASRDTNILSTHISRCARGKKSTAGGFIWKYKNNIL